MRRNPDLYKLRFDATIIASYCYSFIRGKEKMTGNTVAEATVFFFMVFETILKEVLYVR